MITSVMIQPSETMRYIIGICLISLLLFPVSVSASFVDSTIDAETVYQYIHINCDNMQCEQLMLGLPVEMQSREDTPIQESGAKAYQFNDVRINEIVALPNNGDPEWIELYNSLASKIDLEDWELVEGSGQSTKLDGEINGKGYLVFDKSSLNNSGDTIILKDPAGNIIDQVTYGDWDDGDKEDNVPTVSRGNSLIYWQGDFRESKIVTAGKENVYLMESQAEQVQAEPPQADNESNTDDPNSSGDSVDVNQEEFTYQFSEEVIISEVMPNPVGDDDSEWIKIYNSAETDLDLLGWSIDDVIDGGSVPYTFKSSTVLKGNDYYVLNKEESGLVLNNGTDEVNIIAPSGIIVDTLGYENPKEGISISLDQEISEDTLTVSDVQVASHSMSTTTPSYLAVNINQVRELPLKSKIQLSGVVTVLPGTFGKNYMYIDGLQLYFSKADWPELQLNDVISVKGTISESQGERRLLIKEKEDIVMLGQDDLFPVELSSELIGEQYEGRLIKLSGELLEKSSSKLIFSDDLGEFIVYAKQGTQLKSSMFDEGVEYEIVGVVSQSGDDYRLQPRFEEDVKKTSNELLVAGAVQTESVVSVSGNNSYSGVFWGLVVTLFVLLSVNAWFLYQHRQKLKDKVLTFFSKGRQNKKISWLEQI